VAFSGARLHPAGTGPGPGVAAQAVAPPPTLSLIDYDNEHCEERECLSVAEAMYYFSLPTITWLHVHGAIRPEQIRTIGEQLGLHPLVLEDVLNTGQRPKAEAYGEDYFVVLSLPRLVDSEIVTEQVCLFLGENYVLSFYRGQNDPFGPIRHRLCNQQGRFGARKADYLFYVLVDMVIDQGFPILEVLGERVEEIETELLESPARATLHALHALKRDLLVLRRFLWPQREVLNTLIRDEHPLVQHDTRLFLRDCYDHTVQIMDMLETYRDMAASMLDVYLSSVSHRLNEIMRVLTVIATVFMPLTFITGLYGMNFDRAASPWNMPELGWYYGYPLILLVIIAIAGAMLVVFRRRKWI
jgi:magnesium transporter